MLPKITPDGRHVVYYPPTVIKGIEGNFFAVSGQVWIEVPENTTLEEANKLFCWGEEARKHWDSSYTEEPVKVIEVKGSRGNTYRVTKQGDKWKCDCPGFRFRSSCKHTKKLQNLIST